MSALALGLTVARRYEPAEPGFPSVVRAVLHDDDGPVDGVVLAGRIFVSWSSTLSTKAAMASGR